MQNVEPKLHEVADVIFRHIDQGKLNGINNPGIYAGSSGIILFLSHYLKRFPDQTYESVYENYFNIFLDEISSRPQSVLTYCSGLAGVLTSLRMMNDGSLIELDFSELEEAYRDKTLAWLSYSFANCNYDLLHGALGPAIYFRHDSQYVETTLLQLRQCAIEDNGKLKWLSSLGQDRPMGYNISLSHGISSIIVYLCRIYGSGVMTELHQQLLEGAVNYVLSQEIDPGEHGCFFPSQSLENGEPVYRSRLAWCYGDLGVAAALWQAGKVTKNRIWLDKALMVYRFSAGRKDLQNAMVNDTAICHGTAGIAMMFSYMYRQTGDILLMKARDYWVGQTLAMGRFPDGLAGYKKFTLDDDQNIKWENSYSLLDGVAGIGLVFLSTFDKDAENDLFESFGLH